MHELAELELEYVPLANMGIREILSPKLQPLSISTLPGSRRIEFDWRALWYALRASGIELLTLKAWGPENAMDEMFDYLLSYTGLQRLDISDLQMNRLEAEDQAAQKFWRHIVSHAFHDHITSLCIYSRFESGFCYGRVDGILAAQSFLIINRGARAETGGLLRARISDIFWDASPSCGVGELAEGMYSYRN